MNVANDVKGTVFIFTVVPKRLTLNFYGFNFFYLIEDVDVAKALSFQSAQGPPQKLGVTTHDMRTKLAVWSLLVALVT